MDFLTLKALHIIFVVSWFSGLFYIVRLFIYHTEAQDRPETERTILSAQFKIMEARLWWIITTPAMLLTLVFGIWMLVEIPEYIAQGWMLIKLGFVLLLLLYHFQCQRMLRQLQQDKFLWSSSNLRIWNEVATLCLVAIVFLVTLRNTLDWITGTIAFFAVAIGLMLLIKLYKRYRNKN